MGLINKYKEKKNLKNVNTWRLNNILLNNQEITEEIKERERERERERNQLETNGSENMMTESSSKGEIYVNTILPQDTRKIWNKQPNLTINSTRERRIQTNKKTPKLVEGKKS